MPKIAVWDDFTQSYLEIDVSKVLDAVKNLEFLKLPEQKLDPAFYAVTTGENVVLRVADVGQWAGLHPAPGETVEFTATMQLINKG